MKYDVTFSCGHQERIELFGKNSERDRKIDYYKNYGVCRECYRAQKEIENAIGCDEIEMTYRQYKQEYANCKTKNGSWNPETKTIVVYVKKKAM